MRCRGCRGADRCSRSARTCTKLGVKSGHVERFKFFITRAARKNPARVPCPALLFVLDPRRVFRDVLAPHAARQVLRARLPRAPRHGGRALRRGHQPLEVGRPRHPRVGDHRAWVARCEGGKVARWQGITWQRGKASGGSQRPSGLGACPIRARPSSGVGWGTGRRAASSLGQPRQVRPGWPPTPAQSLRALTPGHLLQPALHP